MVEVTLALNGGMLNPIPSGVPVVVANDEETELLPCDPSGIEVLFVPVDAD